MGILVAYTIGAFVDWWLLAFILSVFPLILLTGMIFMPESPVWLMAHNREDEARQALQRLRGKYDSFLNLYLFIDPNANLMINHMN